MEGHSDRIKEVNLVQNLDHPRLMSLSQLTESTEEYRNSQPETGLIFKVTDSDIAPNNNVKATIDKVLSTCGSNVQVLICGSFYFMGDAKLAIQQRNLVEND